jgi:hypothetical protein
MGQIDVLGERGDFAFPRDAMSKGSGQQWRLHFRVYLGQEKREPIDHDAAGPPLVRRGLIPLM